MEVDIQKYCHCQTVKHNFAIAKLDTLQKSNQVGVLSINPIHVVCGRKNRCCLLFEECRGIFHCTVQLCTSVQHVYSMCTLTDDFSSLKLSRQFYGWGGDDGRWSCLKLIVM